MKQTIAFFLSIFLFSTLAIADQCYAPLNAWGPQCRASVPFQGTKASYVNYHISVLQPQASVYCYGLGISEYASGAMCQWQLQNLGMINPQYVSVVWDNANAYPIISCYARGASSTLEWTYSTGVGQITCLRKSRHPHKLLKRQPTSKLLTE